MVSRKIAEQPRKPTY